MVPGLTRSDLPRHLLLAKGRANIDFDKGMPPEEVATKVREAMRNEQFWILTHDEEGDFWVDAVKARLRSLETRANPQLGLPEF